MGGGDSTDSDEADRDDNQDATAMKPVVDDASDSVQKNAGTPKPGVEFDNGSTSNKKKKKKKKKANKNGQQAARFTSGDIDSGAMGSTAAEPQSAAAPDDDDATIRAVQEMFHELDGDGNVLQSPASAKPASAADAINTRAILAVDRRNLSPEAEMRRVFGTGM